MATTPTLISIPQINLIFSVVMMGRFATPYISVKYVNCSYCRSVKRLYAAVNESNLLTTVPLA
ncbi:hypothetical protein L873DRAFT_1432763 [Choiromyces venosus 120613-1]|uniref:Uncharacterized protein n=1 Tax=Choiromyces venosus 120613-1 TaxID=1336337 RepID=A0A3N4JBM8_9PEZI|nr:hypothetical protein L873DRAFT_1432763 [Choiromyces venosus 120613-1]